MTAKQRIDLQDRFLQLCTGSGRTLHELIKDMRLPPETLAGWLNDEDFRRRLRAVRRRLRQERDFQIELGAARAAAMLARLGDAAVPAATKNAVVRAACVDMIRLARDGEARRRATDVPVDSHRPLHHLAVPPGEAQALMDALDGAAATRADDGTDEDEDATPGDGPATSSQRGAS